MENIDCKIALMFSKLFIPGVEADKFIIDVQYLGENIRVNYPMYDPIFVNLKDLFNTDKSVINIVVMQAQNQKYRKLAKGEINIYRKYVLLEKFEIEKFVHLELIKTQIEKQTYGSTIINAVSSIGKVLLKACLIDKDVETSKVNTKDKKDLLTIFSKTNVIKNTRKLKNIIKSHNQNQEKLGIVKPERFKSISMKENELIQGMIKDSNKKKSAKSKNEKEDSLEDIPIDEKPYNDNLSDLSITVIEGLEDDCIKIEEINSEMNDFISKVKVMFDEKFDQILPSNNEELKLFINKIAKQIQTIAENYITSLEQLQEINKRIKQQARVYYEKYKEKKREFKKDRNELKKKNQKAEEEINENIEENKKVKVKFDDFKAELNYFKSLVGLKDDSIKMGKSL